MLLRQVNNIKVYIIKHDSYAYEGDEFESYVEVFDSLKSANEYFELAKENIRYEYISESGAKNIEDFYNNNDVYIDSEPNVYGYPYYFINMSEFGFDRLVILEKSVMSFE